MHVELELEHTEPLAQALDAVLDGDGRGAVAEQGEHSRNAAQQPVDTLHQPGGVLQRGELDEVTGLQGAQRARRARRRSRSRAEVPAGWADAPRRRSRT